MRGRGPSHPEPGAGGEGLGRCWGSMALPCLVTLDKALTPLASVSTSVQCGVTR